MKDRGGWRNLFLFLKDRHDPTSYLLAAPGVTINEHEGHVKRRRTAVRGT